MKHLQAMPYGNVKITKRLSICPHGPSIQVAAPGGPMRVCMHALDEEAG